MGPRATVQLRPVPASAATARHFASATLQTWGLQDLGDTATLLVSELVTNAILHAHTDVDLVLQRCRDGVRVEVGDLSPGRLTPRGRSAEAVSGRGLDLVQTLSADWGVLPRAVGKAVWFRLDC